MNRTTAMDDNSVVRMLATVLVQGLSNGTLTVESETEEKGQPDIEPIDTATISH